MDSEITVAIIALLGSIIGTFGGILAASKLTAYRIEQLEKKVDKHNNVIERFALLEQDNNNQWKRIDELRASLERLKEEEIRHEH